MRSKLERAFVACAALAFTALIAARGWDSPGYDLSALAVGAKMLDDGHAKLLYEHNPVYYNLADAPEFRTAATELGFTEYAPTPFVHPPLVAFVAKPLARIPFATLLRIWDVLSAIATVAALALAMRLYAPSARALHFAILLGALIPFEPILYGLWLSQTTPFVVLAVLGALALVRRGREASAGVLLALAVFVKLTPIAFALVWIFERRWRAVVALVVALALLAVASCALVGVQANLDFIHRVRQIGGITLIAYNNHSAVASLTRLAGGPSPELFTMVVPPLWARAVVAAGTMAGVAGAAWAVRGRVRQSEPLLEVFAMLAILLLPSIAWTHYFLLLVPAVLLALELAPRGAKWRAAAAGLLVLAPCERPIIADYTQFNPKHSGWMAGPTVAALAAFAVVLALSMWRRRTDV